MTEVHLGRLTGFFFLMTFVTAIPAVAIFYRDAITDPAFVLGGGFDAGVATGAVLELALILANIATALTVHPVIGRRTPVLALAYLAARLVECGFIAVGIVALLALDTLRLSAAGADPATLVVAGQTLVTVHAWTFRLGPGVVVGVGNGLILGVAMWRARLVPRRLSIIGIIGGLALVAAGLAVIFGLIEAGGTAQAVLTLPEVLWEFGLGLWLLVKGFPLPRRQC